MTGSLAARDISKSFGAVQVLEHVSLVVSAGDRVGIVGPNGIGKSTLLRVLAGLEQPDRGTVVRHRARRATCRRSPRSRRRRRSSSRLPGGRAWRRQPPRWTRSPNGWPRSRDSRRRTPRRSIAFSPSAATTSRRAHGVSRSPMSDSPAPPASEVRLLSGGEAARVSLAAILLARFDVFLLDEPTNNLDFAGLERLERFLSGLAGGVVLVSHDRAFLDRTVTRVVEIEAETRRVHEYAGTWSDYEAARERARAEHRARVRAVHRASRRGRATTARAEIAGTGARRRAQARPTDGRLATAARPTHCVRRSPRRGASSSSSSRSTSRGRPGGSSSRSPDPRGGRDRRAPRRSGRARRLPPRPDRPRAPLRRPRRRRRPERVRQDDAAPGAHRRAPARLGEPRRGRARPSSVELEQGRSRFTGDPARRLRRAVSASASRGTDAARQVRTRSRRRHRAPPPPSPRASAPAPRSPSSPPAASTACSSTSRPTTSTSRRSSGSNARSTTYEGALVVVSHDRRFLDRLATDRTIALGGASAPAGRP